MCTWEMRGGMEEKEEERERSARSARRALVGRRMLCGLTSATHGCGLRREDKLVGASKEHSRMKRVNTRPIMQ
jgi:hypothetical protein